MTNNRASKLYPPLALVETWLELIEHEDEAISRRAVEMLQTKVGKPNEIRAYLKVNRG
ncbi:hypothetical protein TUM3794_21040 [Shewanella colwelliana]|uniref:Uncharacterized protein n=1 Tax=Shewanella colwelliana TaxID=23 RepID=A0ABQ4P0W4_SHECO|nr:hypothetical protein [Shewanella colwelliana]GIU41145.1 hypothetical protein TUM3794_21040 [Shewanella colwelliana]